MTEPILNARNMAMRGSECSDCDQEPEHSFLGRTVEDVLFRAYRLRAASRCAKGFRFEPDSGFEGATMGIEGVLVIVAIRRVLGLDHLVLTIDAMYGGEPEDIHGLSHVLSAFSGRSLRMAFEAVESYALGRMLSSYPSGPERKLDEWHEIAVTALRRDFVRRKWIPSESLDTGEIL